MSRLAHGRPWMLLALVTVAHIASSCDAGRDLPVVHGRSLLRARPDGDPDLSAEPDALSLEGAVLEAQEGDPAALLAAQALVEAGALPSTQVQPRNAPLLQPLNSALRTFRFVNKCASNKTIYVSWAFQVAPAAELKEDWMSRGWYIMRPGDRLSVDLPAETYLNVQLPYKVGNPQRQWYLPPTDFPTTRLCAIALRFDHMNTLTWTSAAGAANGQWTYKSWNDSNPDGYYAGAKTPIGKGNWVDRATCSWLVPGKAQYGSAFVVPYARPKQRNFRFSSC